MRSSVLSRTLVAAASLTVASAVLAAVPATAATASGITREQVLTATNGLRASYESADDPSAATQKALRAIVGRGCAVDTDNGEILYAVDGIPTAAGASSDGLAAYGQIVNLVDGTTHDCVVGVVASSTADHLLSGSATLSVKTNPLNQFATVTTALSGDVTATRPVNAGTGIFTGEPTFTASGAATKTVAVPAKTVKDRKTKAEKKAAKKKYAKKLKAAKASYAKAVKKAGGSKSKKAAAQKTYSAKKKAAKAAYRYAIANYRIVKKATTATDVQPFSLSLLTL